ncbi:MAG: M15 family metallopeptidase, partial [Nocardioidaceae bacterium]
VLANDTDDGQGRPTGEPPRLEVARFDATGGRVLLRTDDSGRQVLAFVARSSDTGRAFTVGYEASDGTLTSGTARVRVTVTAPAPPARRVTLLAPGELVALHPSVLHGGVSTPRPAPVTVTVQRLAGTRWQLVRRDRVDAAGRWSVPFGTNRPVRHVFRAVAVWQDGRRAVSDRLTRTVVARAEAVVSGPLPRTAVRWSFRAGCPVSPAGLRRVTINRFTYSGAVARGSLVVRSNAVPDLLRVFRGAFANRFPVRSMRPAEVFYAGGRRTPTQSDLAAMRADNTSAFNCRPVTGNPYRVSQHSYGNAIDINTVRNPYVVGSRVYPSFARTYLDRQTRRTGMITADSVIARTMRSNGWPWGARWAHPDYQHFSANGG